MAPWVGGGLLCAALPASAQYSLQMADDVRTYSAPASRMAPAAANRDYNLKLGPTEWSFYAGMNLGWTSNARLDNNDRSSSLVLRPTATANMFMPIAERASLSMGFTMGYNFYLTGNNSDLNGFYMTPNSRLAYTMYVGDVQLTFSDAMSMSQFDTMSSGQPSNSDPTIGNDPNARTFNNSFAITASTVLYRTQLTGGFSQYNSWQLSGNTGVGDTGSQNLFAQAGYMVLPELTVGLSGGLTWQHYAGGTQTILEGGFQWNVGPYVTWQATEQLAVNGSFGYTVFTQDYLYGLPSTDTDSMYWTIGFSHRISELVTYSLSGGHTITPGYYSGPTDAYNATLGLTWYLVKDLSISTPFSYYNGVGLTPANYLSSEGLPTSTADRFQTYNTGISFGYAFNPKLTGSLSYNFNYRTQQGDAGDYTVNGVSIGLTYRF